MANEDLDLTAAAAEARAAETEVLSAEAEFDRRVSEQDLLVTAIKMARETDADRRRAEDLPHLKDIRKAASARLFDAERRTDRVLDEIREYEIAIIPAARERLSAALKRQELARGRHKEARALQLAPRQGPAVRKIASALEKLSEAVAAASLIQGELEAKCRPPSPAIPWVHSQRLPDIVGELAHTNLGLVDSNASKWARRMKQLGLL